MTYVINSESESEIEYEFQGKAEDQMTFEIDYESEVTTHGTIQDVRKRLAELAKEYDAYKAEMEAKHTHNELTIKLLEEKLNSVHKLAEELANMKVIQECDT